MRRTGRRSATNTTGLAALGAVLLLVLGIWLGNGRNPGTSTERPDAGASDTFAHAGSPQSPSDLATVRLSDLPAEAVATVRLIDVGGPYPYDRDGATFGNYEYRLPSEPHGYYQEFTVDTPGSEDRGARRIIAGQERELYWTADHYATFALIVR